jgi:probable O-glycosylation ligase (exosortase A-associated)
MKPLLFTYALTFGGALVSLFRPYWGLLIYICFSILTPEAMWYWAIPRFNYSRVVAIALLVGWVLNGCGAWKFGRAKGIVIALLCIWALITINAALTHYPNNLTWVYVESQSKIFLPFIVGMTLIDSIDKLKQLVWVMVLANGYIAYEFNLNYFYGFSADKAFSAGEFLYRGLDNNSIAITMVTGVGLAFFLALHAEKGWQKLVAAGCMLFMVHVIFFSMSRGGMLALLVTGVLAFILIPKTGKHYLFFALAVLLALRLAGPSVQQRFMSSFADKQTRDNSAGSRLEQWKACLNAMGKNVVVGVGPRAWPLAAQSYGATVAREAHSTWFQFGAEFGIPALGCLVFFYGACGARLWKYTRGRQQVADPWIRHISRMVIAALVGFAVSSQFVTVDGIEMPYYVVLIGAGLLKVISTGKYAAPVTATDSNAKLRTLVPFQTAARRTARHARPAVGGLA